MCTKPDWQFTASNSIILRSWNSPSPTMARRTDGRTDRQTTWPGNKGGKKSGFLRAAAAAAAEAAAVTAAELEYNRVTSTASPLTTNYSLAMLRDTVRVSPMGQNSPTPCGGSRVADGWFWEARSPKTMHMKHITVGWDSGRQPSSKRPEATDEGWGLGSVNKRLVEEFQSDEICQQSQFEKLYLVGACLLTCCFSLEG